MPRDSETYVCQSCGAVTAKWAGRCDACSAWNSIVLEAASASPHAPRRASRTRKAVDFVSLDAAEEASPRIVTGDNEFDRVCGGGVASGAAILVGGDPGVGKSTLLLQVCARVAHEGLTAVYISGEESANQIRLRAERLGLSEAPVKLATETRLAEILSALRQIRPAVAIIDSIQTLWSEDIPSAPGTVTQMRACAHELVRYAKATGAAIVLVGHVTKDGQIAGPKVIEHMVDAVLYFETDAGQSYRILRSVKNRFGPANEIGVFEMTAKGLANVENPSALFLSERGEAASGAAVFAGVEGTRPLLVEFQALTAPSQFGSPRRATVGWDSARLSMILAVLESRCGVRFSDRDVYLNVAGGFRITEPAADLAAAAALLSAHFDIALPQESVVFGEISLSGRVRAPGLAQARLKEAARLGFTSAIAPPLAGRVMDDEGVAQIAPTEFKAVADFVEWLSAAANGKARA